MKRRQGTGAPGHRQAGFTLIELLVALAIGLALVLAITIMLFRYESGRRALTATNDAAMGSGYAAYTLDRTLRSAGSGFTQSWRTAFGCRLLAARAGDTVLPRAAAFPAPFDSVPVTEPVRLAPVVIFAGAGTDGSDVLSVMTGSSGLGETRLPVTAGSITTSSLKVSATIGMRAGDLYLVLQDGTTNCMVQQAAAGFAGGATQQIDFGGGYANASIEGVNLTDLGAGIASSYVIPLGNATIGRPRFELIGVGGNATLVSHDLLSLDGAADAVTAIVDGVADLRALYGVDINGDNVVDSWVAATGTDWGAAALLDGSGPANQRLGQIVAVRVGLMVRTSTPEKDDAAPGTLTVFGDLAGLAATRTLTADEKKMHWRTLDFTVPLRNQLFKQ